jgi:hypothetical protein
MSKPSRRRFLQAVAVGTALPLAAVPTLEAGEPASAEQALLTMVRQRFKHLSEDQFKTVQTSLRRGLAAAEVLKRIRLAPVDEPATVFVADVAE